MRISLPFRLRKEAMRQRGGNDAGFFGIVDRGYRTTEIGVEAF